MGAKDTPDTKYIEQINPRNLDEGPLLILPGTDFSYTYNGEIYLDLICTEEFGRLDHIKQLGTVGCSAINACQWQTRGFHSEITSIMMDIVLYKNKFSDHERKLGIAAGLYHDLGILPYSDQGKLIKPGSYEEETLVEHIINKSTKIKKRLKKHNIEIKELVDIIQGKGKIGELLNSKKGLDVDNISYLAMDQVTVCTAPPFDDMEVLRNQKGIFDQYNNIKFIEGKWVFNNPKLLTKLLKFRALMYERVYHNPFNRAKEAFLIKTLKGHHLELDEIMKWEDGDLEEWIKTTFGYHPTFRNFFHIGVHPFREIGREHDLTKLDQLKKEKENETIAVERLKSPRDALHNFVLHKGKVKLLEEVPELSKDLEEIRNRIRRLNYIGIYEMATDEHEHGFGISTKDLREMFNIKVG